MLKLNDLKETQQKAIDRLYEHDATMLIAPKGFGKCVVGYTAIQDLIADDVLDRILVLSTAQVCKEVWNKEADKWEHLTGLDVICLTGSSVKERHELMKKDSRVVICNFELMAWLFTEYPEAGFDGLLVDEITKLKAVGGTGFKKIRKFLKHFKWSVGMTADPVAQESVEIYAQMLIIDHGQRLGRNRENFKRKYFMQMDYLGHDWEFQPGGLARLTKVLSDVIFTVDSAAYTEGLPALVDVEVPIRLPEETRGYYIEMAKHNFVYVKNQALEAPNAASMQSKLFQMCCGTVYRTTEDDEFTDRKTAKREEVFLHSAKMRALDKLVKSIDTPILISYQFAFQRDQLIEKYDAPVFSASNTKKTNDKIMKMWDSGELPILLIHPKSAGHGLNLQYGNCSDLICLSYFWSADEWDQLIGRIRRRGQKASEVTRYTIFCTDTVEDCVMKPMLEKREDAAELFHEYLSNQKIPKEHRINPKQ